MIIGIWSWSDCVRASESERESTPGVVMFGLLWAVCQHPPGKTMCFVYVFNVHVSGRIWGGLMVK
jgi:hypothetical protein